MNSRLQILEPRWLIVIAFFLAGIFLGGLTAFFYLNTGLPLLRKIHPALSGFKYINPLLAVDIQKSQQFFPNTSLALQVQGLIDANKKSGDMTDAAAYFQDLESGVFVGINDNVLFSPGKLLKIPIMIAYFKIAQNDPRVLNEELTYSGLESTAPQIFPPEKTLEVDKTYTVEELIERMIIYSDDNAANLLFDFIDKTSLNEVFSDLGVNFRENKETQDFISLKLYSLFFRILYNSTYLNREFSEKALNLLVQSPNVVGLGAKLPKDVDFANREGGRKFEDGGQKLFEAYDCGITYYPNHPYLVCSVTRGRNLGVLKNFLADLGRVVYVDVDYRYKRL